MILKSLEEIGLSVYNEFDIVEILSIFIYSWVITDLTKQPREWAKWGNLFF